MHCVFNFFCAACSSFCFLNGEVPERLNGAVSKTVVGATPPRVRIPASPPFMPTSQPRKMGLPANRKPCALNGLPVFREKDFFAAPGFSRTRRTGTFQGNLPRILPKKRGASGEAQAWPFFCLGDFQPGNIQLFALGKPDLCVSAQRAGKYELLRCGKTAAACQAQSA